MSKYIINNSGSTKNYKGIPVLTGTSFEIVLASYPAFATCENLVEDIGSGTVDMSVDGTTSLSVAKGLELLVTVYPASKELMITEQPAFAAKTIGDKSLFSRVAGKKFTVAVGSNNLLYTVPYATMKFNGIELLGCDLGDSVDLFVLDSIAGTYTGVPDYVLNQFGYTVYTSANYYERHSNYDADLYAGMQIKIIYTSVSAKDVYVNYVLHELK